MPLSVTCTNAEKKTVFITPKTDPVSGFPGGRPAAYQPGSLVITPRAGGDGTVEYDENFPGQFKAVSGELLGDTIYDLSADADLGAGVVPITDTVTLTVTSAQAKNFGLTEGPTELKDVAA